MTSKVIIPYGESYEWAVPVRSASGEVMDLTGASHWAVVEQLNVAPGSYASATTSLAEGGVWGDLEEEACGPGVWRVETWLRFEGMTRRIDAFELTVT